MTSPLNYIVQTPDPLAQVMQGFQAGTAIRQQPLMEQRAAEDRARLGVEQGQADTNFANQQTLFGQQQSDRAAAQAQAEQERQQALQMRAELEALSANPNATAQEYIALADKYPSIGDAMRENWAVLDEANKTATFKDLSQISAAISLGNIEVARGMLSDRAEAMRNAGKDAEAASSEAMLSTLDVNPSAVTTALAIGMAAVDPEKFSDVYSTIEEQRRATSGEDLTLRERNAKLAEMAASAGLSDAKKNQLIVQTQNMSIEAARALIEFEALQESGGVTTEDAFNMEDKLRKEYVSRIGTYPLARVQFDKLNAAASLPDAETGAGDVALIFSFMKMLDPGSVVRESEFALAQDTAGLLTSLQNKLSKANNGEFMSPAQRAEMVALAGKFMEAAESEAQRVQSDLMIPVNSYGLSAENVFGTAGQIQSAIPQEEQSLTGVQGLFQQFGGGN